MISENIFHVKINPGLYLISSTKSAPSDDGKSLSPGASTQNSYLIVGKEKSLLFDLAIDEPGLYEYAQHLAQKDMITVLSHGHFDHIFRLNSLQEVWLHKDDEFFLREGMPMFHALPVIPCPQLHYLKNGDEIELGNRRITVIHIPGHSPGSIMLLDQSNRVLLSGDTISRSILMGASGKIDIEKFCKSLEALKKEPFDTIYCAHDRCPLTKEHIDLMTDVFRENIQLPDEEFFMSGTVPFLRRVYGKMDELSYFCLMQCPEQ